MGNRGARSAVAVCHGRLLCAALTQLKGRKLSAEQWAGGARAPQPLRGAPGHAGAPRCLPLPVPPRVHVVG